MGRYSSSYDIKRVLKTNEEAKNAILPMFTDVDGVVYGDDAPTVSMILGAPNKGKTVLLYEFICNAIAKGEILLVGDTKGTLYAKTHEMAREAGYDVYLINFCDPENSDGFDPVRVHAINYQSGGLRKEVANISMDSLADSTVPKGNDAYWVESPKNAILGSARYLFEFFDAKTEIGATALHDVLNEGEQRVAGDLIFRDMSDLLDKTLDVANPLSEVAHAPNETRASTIAISKAAISNLTKTEGMRKVLERNNIDLVNFDCEKKAIFYFIVPDESDVYTTCSAVLFDSVIKRYYLESRETGCPLNRRLNIVIDELGNLGTAMGSFHSYCTASRSRNIRIVAAIHSYKQLQVFGEDKMEVIKEACANTICYSLYNIETLEEISKRSGKYKNPIDGTVTPTISPESISKLQPGHVLVFSNELIFTNKFEFDSSKSTDVPIVFPKYEQQVELKKRTEVLRPILDAKREEVEKMLAAKMPEEVILPMPKKQNIFKRIFRRFFRQKARFKS